MIVDNVLLSLSFNVVFCFELVSFFLVNWGSVTKSHSDLNRVSDQITKVMLL